MKMKSLSSLAFIVALPWISVAQENNIGRVLASDGGRYVFGQISSAARHQFMLDTQTGRLWVIVADEQQRLSLEPVPYFGLDAKLSLIPSSKENDLTWSPPPVTNTQKASQTQSERPKYSPEDYDALAKIYEAKGLQEMAIAARQKAADLRKKDAP